MFIIIVFFFLMWIYIFFYLVNLAFVLIRHLIFKKNSDWNVIIFFF